jgi:hypothetical protein
MNINWTRRLAAVACLPVAAWAVYELPASGATRLAQVAWCATAVGGMVTAVVLLAFEAEERAPWEQQQRQAGNRHDGHLQARHSDLPEWIDEPLDLDLPVPAGGTDTAPPPTSAGDPESLLAR